MPEIPPPASTSLPSQPTTTTSSAPSHNTSSSSPSSREAEEERENEKGEVASLPSISSGILDSVSDLSSEDDDDDDGLSDAQREWEASLEQLQLLLTMVVVPFAGKFLGRKFAYWSEFHSPISFLHVLGWLIVFGFWLGALGRVGLSPPGLLPARTMLLPDSSPCGAVGCDVAEGEVFGMRQERAGPVVSIRWYLNWLTDLCEQVGRDTWSGCTMWRFGGQTRQSLQRLAR